MWHSGDSLPWYTCDMPQPRLTVTGTNIDAPDANALADFYRRLLGWTTRTEEPGWVVIRPADGGQTLSFQTEPRYVRRSGRPARAISR